MAAATIPMSPAVRARKWIACMIASSLPKSAGSACVGVKPTLTGQQFKA
jgi:hypothetical protein